MTNTRGGSEKGLAVGLVGLLNDTNLGDPVIGDCCEYLLRREEPAIKITRIDLDIQRWFPYRLFHKIYRDFAVCRDLVLSLLIAICAGYYTRKLRNIDAVIFAGGGLIKHDRWWGHSVCGVVRAAERRGVPVYFNAAGVEGYSRHSRLCMFLKEALNSRAVKMITTRDDIETLRNEYLGSGSPVECAKVADPAVYAGCVYTIRKDPQSGLVGLGLIRGGIFMAHGKGIAHQQLLELYGDIIVELKKRALPYRLFNNGHRTDIDFARELSLYTGRKELLENMVTPHTARELVQCVSGFAGIIAPRLHANIIAYSLDVPSVALVWNDKLSFWGANIGYPERFVLPERFNAVYIVDQLQKAMTEGYDEKQRRAFMNTEKESVKKMFSMIRGDRA